MSGIKLERLEASDMLDVIHFFFEDSNNFSSAEQAKAADQLRIRLYKDMYKRTYKYASSTNSYSGASGTFDFEEEQVTEKAEEIKPFNPRHKEPTKAYVAPTTIGDDEVNPFKGVLDAPIS